ncbi:M3 family oligoendopeptidase [Desulfovibrio inopinatus]|uniref:M3 family oligoendopeptidase n=1 Tax=Desulfovibrio inopinatus TaxID=102109 RepID=UPI000417904F|nr:M3 family oligoendopeptidase [Desulfovibrio inopinatus]
MELNTHANWDMTVFFPEFGGKEHLDFTDKMESDLNELALLTAELKPIGPETAEAWVEAILRIEKIIADRTHLGCYLHCLAAADAQNEQYAAAIANLSRTGALFSKALAPVDALLKKVDDDDFEALLSRRALDSARYYLERSRQEAKWTMSAELEKLAADLMVDGLSAWSRLYDNVSSKLTFTMPGKDGPETVPMAQKRSLLDDPDPIVRKNALVNSNAAWDEVCHVAAASLNAIAGTRLTLYDRRGVPHFLDQAAFDAATTRKTIDAMWRAVDKFRDIPHTFLKQKAKLIGRDRLGFQDISCPLPGPTRTRYSWSEGAHFVQSAFDQRYPALGTFVREIFAQRGVESEKRPGKRPGAFCSTSYKHPFSRVFMTFGGSLNDIQTLAHELGHAWHGYLLRDVRPLSRMYPMTLAETASTFAESILQEALINQAPDNEEGKAIRRSIVTARLNDAAIFTCDIHMRYLFEKSFYEERKAGQVSPTRLKELMLEAQETCFGDTLDPNELDPLFWASKLHFYISGVSFYNFPYTFGFLLSRAITSLAQKSGSEFFNKYEYFLSLTGQRTCEQAVSEAFNMDISYEAFWAQALETIQHDMDVFDATV